MSQKKMIMLALIHFILSRLSQPLLINNENLTCSESLLTSYDLLGETSPTVDKNLFCPNILSNCCSYQSQLSIYKKWVIQGERDRILNFYKVYKQTFNSIFNSLNSIEAISRKTLELAEEIEGSNCYKMALLINKYKFSNLKTQVIESIKRAFKFFYESRQGFYCAICDASATKFFNVEKSTIEMSFEFCKKMVDQTLNFYLFRYDPFIKFARLYSTFVTSCDQKGRFHSNRLVRTELMFFKKDEFGGEMESCKRGFKQRMAMDDCSEYCARFNPVRYDRNFEGEIEKLVKFGGYLKQKSEYLEKEMGLVPSQNFMSETEGFLGVVPGVGTGSPVRASVEERRKKERVLMETGVGAELNAVNEYVSMNAVFKTNYVRPLDYKFDDDMSIKLDVNFEESVIKLATDPSVDLMDFERFVEEEGVDFHELGSEAIIDNEIAKRIFEQMNPEKKSQEEFDNFLRKKE